MGSRREGTEQTEEREREEKRAGKKSCVEQDMEGRRERATGSRRWKRKKNEARREQEDWQRERKEGESYCLKNTNRLISFGQFRGQRQDRRRPSCAVYDGLCMYCSSVKDEVVK